MERSKNNRPLGIPALNVFVRIDASHEPANYVTHANHTASVRMFDHVQCCWIVELINRFVKYDRILDGRRCGILQHRSVASAPSAGIVSFISCVCMLCHVALSSNTLAYAYHSLPLFSLAAHQSSAEHTIRNILYRKTHGRFQTMLRNASAK